MRDALAAFIDREIHGEPLPESVWDRQAAVLAGREEFGDPKTLERMATAFRIADAVLGGGPATSDEELRSHVYVALKLAKFKRARTPGEDDALVGDATGRVLESLKRAGWRFARLPSYPGWGHEGTGSFSRPQPRCKDCD